MPGDLNVFAKYILGENQETGSLISAGLSLTLPTGPAQFAGASYLPALHPTTIQPFIGYIWNIDRFYLHGFLAVDAPVSTQVAMMVYNDIGVGYFLYRDTDDNSEAWLTAIAPTFETHVNVPLTHNDPYNVNDPGSALMSVNLTYGLNFEFRQRSVLTIGLVTPVTNPRPFDYEAQLLLNVRFGGLRRPAVATPVMVGG